MGSGTREEGAGVMGVVVVMEVGRGRGEEGEKARALPVRSRDPTVR